MSDDGLLRVLPIEPIEAWEYQPGWAYPAWLADNGYRPTEWTGGRLRIFLPEWHKGPTRTYVMDPGDFAVMIALVGSARRVVFLDSAQFHKRFREIRD